MSFPAQQGRAVVVGASVAGLFAGRVLSDHFEEVILLDKESLDGGPTPRKAVPQGNHIHAILPPTYRVIQRFMPELVDELVDGGANIIDGGREWKFHVYGNFMVSGDTGQTLIGSTRPYFEDCLRRNVSSLPNLEIKTAHRFKNWIAGDDRSRINGVAVTGPDGDVDINADLVIDARGRASTMSKELQELDYEVPAEELVGVDLCYTSRLYRYSGPALDWKFLIVNPSAPYTSIGGLIEKVEAGRWIITQFGYFGDQAPADDAGFLERAKSLPVPDIAEFLEQAEPAGDFQTFGTRECKMRRFENLDSVPERLLVIGDAVCSLNPIYGQGMTKAALEAEHLSERIARHLARSESLDGFAQSFRKSLPKAGADWAWQLTTGADLAYRQTTGERKPGGKLMGLYMKRLFERSHETLDSRKRLFDTLVLSNPPTHLFKPRMIGYVLGL
jgi:2-polyprenyl-6-methoxyphenol hydroxylase-like FAD-dependent oxidoreductase